MLVDAADYERLNTVKWSAVVNSAAGGFRAQRKIYGGGTRHTEYAHRVVMNARSGVEVDHINMDALDNRRSNLRVVPYVGRNNLLNRGQQRNGTSGYKGVTWNKDVHKWQAQIQANKRHQYLGVFSDPIEAARAYDAAALRLHGEFARLNFPVHR